MLVHFSKMPLYFKTFISRWFYKGNQNPFMALSTCCWWQGVFWSELLFVEIMQWYIFLYIDIFVMILYWFYWFRYFHSTSLYCGSRVWNPFYTQKYPLSPIFPSSMIRYYMMYIIRFTAVALFGGGHIWQQYRILTFIVISDSLLEGQSLMVFCDCFYRKIEICFTYDR